MVTRLSRVICFLSLLVFFSTAFPQIHISGPLSGTLIDTTYIVDGDISVPEGDSLTIEPGATFLFDGPFSFHIRGLLRAEGTEQDSIIFLPNSPDVFWNGIDFVAPSSDSCLLKYCLIQQSNDNGIEIINCSPTIDHCTVHLSSAIATNGTGGIGIQGMGQPKIINCTITENEGVWGGGININGSRAVISHCIIARNQACFGAGINIGYGDGDVVIDHCLITGNDAGQGGGIFSYPYAASVTIVNCTIAGNSGMEEIGGIGGIQVIGSLSPRIVNVIVANNRGGGIGGTYNIEHSCFYRNPGGNFPYTPNDSLGLIVTTNANGDSCDIYYNIFLDPEFVDTLTGNYHLLSTSPCIDAGDPTYPLDPDSTIADIGAFYYHQYATIDRGLDTIHPTSYRLSQNYPNPFNAQTIISYTIPRNQHVELRIFNLLGHRVQTLVNGYQTAGHKSVTWDASHCASGIYFLQLTTSQAILTKQMILLK
jgi:hypothetical protein